MALTGITAFFHAFFMPLQAHWPQLAQKAPKKTMNLARTVYSKNIREQGERGDYRRRVVPPLGAIKLDQLRLDVLRLAVRANAVTFPSSVPTFERHDRADLQWKLAQLYFVLGWDCEDIAAKYGLIHQRVRQILRTWRRRAVETGYIQLIPSQEVLQTMLQPTLPVVSTNGWSLGLAATPLVNPVPALPLDVRQMALAESGR
jgi:hypothetical protein